MKTRVANEPLANLLDRHTVPGAPELCKDEDDRIRCLACGHRCLIGSGLRGVCKVRFNEGGRLKVPFGYVAGLQSDPVEKKPFFHVLPGCDALTFGMLGCDLHCAYCQNWLTSQALRDSAAVAPIRRLTPTDLVAIAQRERSRLVVSSYNEPLITAEWAVAVFEQAKAAGLACAFVSNGNATPEALDFLRPWIIAYKIDLKSFTERSYRSLGGTLGNITETIRMVHDRGIWLEVVTLVIPGFNDSDEELRQAARFLASVSPNIPWHLTAFHQDYKMTDPEPTSSATLMRAAEIGSAEGLRFVYAGNLPGQVGPWENTRCPSCRGTLIDRFGYLVRSYRLTPESRCPDCQAEIPGVWPRTRAEVRMGNDVASYKSRLPRSVAVSLGPAAPASRSLPLVESRPLSSLQGTPAMPSVTPPAVAVKSRPAQRDDLSAEERERIAAAVAALLRATVLGQPANCIEALGELRDRQVAGAFVSLKRGRHLRSCCGLLGQPIPLAQAVTTAASRTAREDERFPPISPTELDYLDVEVWLLDNPQPVQARGEDRVAAVTIGKHGVQVVRGPSSGLFLPGVAVESNWDARRFLDQVCVKAGLPPTSWKDDATSLFTFEGDALRCQTASGLSSASVPCAGPCRPEEVSAFAAFCLGNLVALLTGRTPSYYFAGADGSVNGVVLSVRRPGVQESLRLSQLSLRHGLPLQSTLFALVQKAAQLLASERLQPHLLSGIEVDLAFLHDPVMHGTVGDPHLAGLDSRRRTVLVVERNKSALVYDPMRPAEELLAEAASEACVTERSTAVVFSLDTLTNGAAIRVANVPRPVRGPAVRPSAVAGTFYAADPVELSRTVDRLLAGEYKPEPWAAALLPHAGLTYSGHIAAAVLKRLRIPDTVIVFSPKHTQGGMDWAVAPHQTWALPGGGMESDFVLARQLCQAVPGLEMDAAAHQGEHGIEVELPMLARLNPKARVVGITIGHATPNDCWRIADGLATVLRERSARPLLLISSDMNHFATDAETRRLDALALDALERRDPAELYEIVTQHGISMCGVLPAMIVLKTLGLLGSLTRSERVGYATTADTTKDTSRVVGYAGIVFG
jgi:AmmeMemoRadiSam system radical SAM enzyme/AmmeMemoRadiSam system protein B/AmmeMemoRadiSam system protein A